MVNRIRFFALFVVVCVCAAQAVAQEGAKAGAPTPQELVERYRAAVAKQDLAALVGCLAPDDRAVLTYSLVAFFLGHTGIAGDGTVPDTAAAKDVAEVFRKNGLSHIVDGKKKYTGDQILTDPGDRDAIKRRLREVFVRDNTDLIAGLVAAGRRQLPADAMKNVDALTGMFPKGTMSTGMIGESEGSGIVDQHPFRFVRIDGRWYITDLLDIKVDPKAKKE